MSIHPPIYYLFPIGVVEVLELTEVDQASHRDASLKPSRWAQLGADPVVDPELAGGIVCFIWRRSWTGGRLEYPAEPAATTQPYEAEYNGWMAGHGSPYNEVS